MQHEYSTSKTGGGHGTRQWPVGSKHAWLERSLTMVVTVTMATVSVQSAAQTVKAQQTECVFTLQSGKKPSCTEPAAVAAPAGKAIPTSDAPASGNSLDLATSPSAPTPTAAPAPAPAPAPKPKWTLQLQDLTLYAAFSRWAKDEGWRVLWDADKHLLIDSPDVVTGDFEQAITAVVSSPGIASGAYPLEVCFYPNTPPLARITKRGDQAKDCK